MVTTLNRSLFLLTMFIFFKEIIYGLISKYESTSFYLIRKQGNVSNVKLWVRKSLEAPTEQENFSPVPNSYAALWAELNEVTSSVTVQNVMRRILEYYFMQLCGYDGNDIRDIVLGEKTDIDLLSRLRGKNLI